MNTNKKNSSTNNSRSNKGVEEDTTRIKYKIGKGVLFSAMIAMAAFVIIDLYTQKLSLESELIEKAFEAFKAITMTVLGYIFGASNPKNSEK